MEIGMKALRHRCRNPHCRMKLPEPVENEHHAFCTRACYESFYLTRCRVCERDLRKRDKETGKPRLVQAGRLYCRPPNKCRLEASKHVSRYDWGGAVAPRNRHPSEVAILRAFPVASRATGHGIRLSAAGHGIPMTWSMSFGTLTERCLPGSRATPVVIG